jgi:hypothetical protein
MSDAVLKIFDLSGRIIKTFKNPHHRVIWEGESDTGEEVGSGIYFCSFETAQFFVIRKFILLDP